MSTQQPKGGVVFTTPLPEKWLFMDSEGQYVSNFVPEVLAVRNRVSDEGLKLESELRLRLLFGDGQFSEEFFTPISKVDKIIWKQLNPRCRLHPDMTIGKARRIISDHIHSLIPSATVENVYLISEMGIHCIKDTIFYRAGNRIICAPEEEGKIDLTLHPLAYDLEIDSERYTERDAVVGIISLLKLRPNTGRVLLAQTLCGIMRSAFISAGITPVAVLQDIGTTGALKTTYDSFLTQIYNRCNDIKPASSLNATLPAIEIILHENRNSVVILDDVHPAEAKEIMRKNELTLEEITRRIGNGTGRQHKNGKKLVNYMPQCSVIVTGEYAYGKGSTAARTLVVDFKEPIDSVELDKLQQEPLVISTFYFYLIRWYVSNYDAIIELLKMRRIAFREYELNVHLRIKGTYFCLCTAYSLFLQYCVEQGFVTVGDAEELHFDFCDILTELVYRQNERVGLDGNAPSPHLDYLHLVRTMYQKDIFKLSSSDKTFHADEHDGFVKDGCLCLRGESLQKNIRKHVPDSNILEIANSLKELNALNIGTDRTARQNFACGGKRFYHIYLEKLR
jgi:hypothetical protein